MGYWLSYSRIRHFGPSAGGSGCSFFFISPLLPSCIKYNIPVLLIKTRHNHIFQIYIYCQYANLTTFKPSFLQFLVLLITRFQLSKKYILHTTTDFGLHRCKKKKVVINNNSIDLCVTTRMSYALKNRQVFNIPSTIFNKYQT